MKRHNEKCIVGLEVYRSPVQRRSVEVLERKGSGHPDSIADAISEGVQEWIAEQWTSRSASDGTFPYSYVDKTLVICGVARPRWKGGRVVEPCRVVLPCVAPREIKLDGCDEVVRRVISQRVPLYPSAEVGVEIVSRPPSTHSIRTFAFEPDGGEDTSVSVAHAPVSDLERVALEIENRLDLLRRTVSPAIGTDAKWLLCRSGAEIRAIVAIAFVGKYLRGLREYALLKEDIERCIQKMLKPIAHSVQVRVNPDDRYTLRSVYLSVTGSSIEGGDCGMTGRGNRTNGVIAQLRPMTIEALSGKPTGNHPSRFGTRAAQLLADALALIPGVIRAEVALLSPVGRNIREPAAVLLRLFTAKPVSRSRVVETVRDQLGSCTKR